MIENKDCLEYIKSLADNSVDLVLTDPPYFIGFDGGKGWDSCWSDEIEYLDCNNDKVFDIPYCKNCQTVLMRPEAY